MSATDPNAQPIAEPTSQPPAHPMVPPASPQAETDTAGGTARDADRDADRAAGRYEPRRLTRSREDRMLTGVCGGLARHLGLDATLVRVLVVLATVMGAGIVAIAYVVAAVVMPLADPAPAPVRTAEPGPVTAPR